MDNTKQHKINLIQHLKDISNYWLNVPGLTEREKIEGVIFSFLVAIDGEASAVGPYVLRPIMEGDIVGPDIGGDLHDMFYDIPGPELKDVKLPDDLLVSIDNAGVHVRKTPWAEQQKGKTYLQDPIFSLDNSYLGEPIFTISNPEIKRQILSVLCKDFKDKKPRPTAEGE